MSLIDEYKKDFVILDRTSRSDGRGSIIYTYVEGAPFKATIVLLNDIEEEKAKKQDIKGIYQLVFEEGIRLGYHTVVKRTEDGKTFRVTSTDDSYTPKSASRQLRKVRAEEYEVAEEEDG